MKKRLILVIALLCMASLMAAMAYSTADVTSDAEMIVTKTEKSLLRFDTVQSSPDAPYTAFVEDGMMKFDFTQGTRRSGDSGFGFQPNSIYTYEKLFRVTNEQNRGNGRTSTIEITATTDLKYLYLYDKNNTCIIYDGESTGAKGVPGHYTVKFKVPRDADMNWLAKGSNIVFTAVTKD